MFAPAVGAIVAFIDVVAIVLVFIQVVARIACAGIRSFVVVAVVLASPVRSVAFIHISANVAVTCEPAVASTFIPSFVIGA